MHIKNTFAKPENKTENDSGQNQISEVIFRKRVFVILHPNLLPNGYRKYNQESKLRYNNALQTVI